jgi:hypothetical protein
MVFLPFELGQSGISRQKSLSRIGQPQRGSVMIKDILVNLSVDKPRDVAGDFAISVASLFDAHLSAVAIACKSPVGSSILDGATAHFVDNWNAQRKAAAVQAQQNFDSQARLASVRASSSLISDYVPEAAKIFGQTARHYDVSVVAQSEQDQDLPEILTLEAALFESGRRCRCHAVPQASGADRRRHGRFEGAPQ